MRPLVPLAAVGALAGDSLYAAYFAFFLVGAALRRSTLWRDALAHRAGVPRTPRLVGAIAVLPVAMALLLPLARSPLLRENPREAAILFLAFAGFGASLPPRPSQRTHHRAAHASVAAILASAILPLAARALMPQERLPDAVRLQGLLLPELFQWCALAALAWLAAACIGWLRWPVAFGAAVVSLVSVVDTVGSLSASERPDVQLLRMLWDRRDQYAPVVRSELGPEHGVVATAAILLPLLVQARVFQRLSGVRGRLAVPLSIAGLAGASALGMAPRDAPLGLGVPVLPHLWRTASPPPPLAIPVVFPAGEAAPRVVEGTPGPNVVVVMLESTRYRSTTLGDPALDTTPNLARLAAEGLSAPQMYAVVPHTTKAVVATLCGYPPDPGLGFAESDPDALAFGCLPRLLRGAGYRTLFLTGAPATFEDAAVIAHGLGFEDTLFEEQLGGPFEKVGYFGWEDRALIPAGLAWSAARPGPFFAVYQTNVSHHPYTVPSTWVRHDFPGKSGREGDYLDAVRYVDTFVGELVEAYRAAGLLENTVFLFLGDHGEGFGEHGLTMHDFVLREEGLHIPLVMWGVPLRKHGILEGLRQQIDVMPTVLELAGLRLVSGALPGASLLGPPPEGPRYFSCWGSERCYARREGDRFYVHERAFDTDHLYDLAVDPEEKHERAASLGPAERSALQTDLRRWEATVQLWYRSAAAFGARARAVEPTGAASGPALGESLRIARCDLEPRPLGGVIGWLACRIRVVAELAAPVEIRAAWAAQKPMEAIGGPVRVASGAGTELTVELPMRMPPTVDPADAPSLYLWDGGPVAGPVEP